MPTAAALAQEMEELESAGGHGSAVVALGPPSFTSPQAYNTNWYNKSFEPATTTSSSSSNWNSPGALATGLRPSSGAPFQEQQQGTRSQSAGGLGPSSSSSCSTSNAGPYQQARHSLTSGHKPAAVMQNNLMGGTSRVSGAAEDLAKYIRG